MFHYFKMPYFTCTFFIKFIYNEYIGPSFFITRCSTIFANEPPKAYFQTKNMGDDTVGAHATSNHSV